MNCFLHENSKYIYQLTLKNSQLFTSKILILSYCTTFVLLCLKFVDPNYRRFFIRDIFTDLEFTVKLMERKRYTKITTIKIVDRLECEILDNRFSVTEKYLH